MNFYGKFICKDIHPQPGKTLASSSENTDNEEHMVVSCDCPVSVSS